MDVFAQLDFSKLDAVLKKQGRKKNWLAGQLGMRPDVFSWHRSGYRGFRFEEHHWAKMAEVLGVPVSTIVPDREVEVPA